MHFFPAHIPRQASRPTPLIKGGRFSRYMNLSKWEIEFHNFVDKL